jgi:hypothetical protein
MSQRTVWDGLFLQRYYIASDLLTLCALEDFMSLAVNMRWQSPNTQCAGQMALSQTPLPMSSYGHPHLHRGYLILPAALGPGVHSASNRNEYQIQ